MPRKTTRLACLGAILAAVALSTGGCWTTDKLVEPFQDAPRSGKDSNSPADVVTMPDGFSNLATKCGPGGLRYTVAYHGDLPYGSIAVTPDPTCPK